MDINLDNLPRTLGIFRADESYAPVPVGFPVAFILDQSVLPARMEYLYMTDWREVMDAIKTLKVRGAPAIGIAGALAMALRAAEFCYAQVDDIRQDAADFDRVFIIDETKTDPELYSMSMQYCANMIDATRPTAKNLRWALDGCMQIVNEELSSGSSARTVADKLFEFACDMIAEDENVNRTMGVLGAELLPEGARILTHCNAGSLATGFFGTALGVVYAAAEQGKVARVYADETRPVNQGSRLTVWELSRAGVPVTLICDDMAASVMAQGMVDAVLVGADRIAANGDVANKIGTLGVAVSAAHFGVPLYVVAPTSSVDLSIESGVEIPIEQRSPSEVLPNAIEGVDVYNPAFDVTPAALVTKIVTERGVFDPADLRSALQND